MMSAMILIQRDRAQLTLRSRGLLSTGVVGLRVRVPNPWFGGCPEVTVSAWDVDGRRVSSMTVQLRDPWFAAPSRYDCLADIDLPLGATRGAYRFTVSQGSDVLGTSGLIGIFDLNPEAPVAEDEFPGFFEQTGDAFEELFSGTVSAVRWLTVGALAVGAIVYAPPILNALGVLSDD